MAFAGLGIIIARGHPLSVVGALASPFTSLIRHSAGWFAGYTQFSPSTGKDTDFLKLMICLYFGK